MKDLKQVVRRLKSRLTPDELYMYVVKDIYYKIFIDHVYYYNFFNTINLKKVIEYVYYNYFICWDNIESVSMNIIELLLDKYLFIRCDENQPYKIKEYMLLNNYHTKQSKEFNSRIENRPQFKNLINDLVEVRLKDYIIDINFIYSILHPNSILYEFIDSDSYDVVLDRLVDYMISIGIAKKIESITKGITLPIGVFNYPFHEEIYLDRLENWDKLIEDYNMHLLYCAYFENFDVLTYVYGYEQLSDTFVENLT